MNDTAAILTALARLAELVDPGMTPAHYARVAAEFHWTAQAGGDVLVFGAGRDTLLWRMICGERLTVAEHAEHWIRVGREAGARVVPVTYRTRARVFMAVPGVPDGLTMDRDYKSVLVDAPVGADNGREQSVVAARVARERFGASVFVHDYERSWERAVCDRHLGEPDELFKGDPQGRRLAFWRRVDGNRALRHNP